MRKLFILLLLCLMPMTSNAGINRGITSHYGRQITTAQFQWMKDRFGIINSDMTWTTTADMAGFPGLIWSEYIDAKGLAMVSEYAPLSDFAQLKGISAEAMLAHSKIDFTYTRGQAWGGMDKFDAFEISGGTQVKGIMLESAGVYTDKTATAYAGSSPWTTIDKNLYIGSELPFDFATFDVRTAATSLVGTWQYWNGSTWATLTVTDGTSGMTVDGTISFTPPSNWARTIVNGSRNKYFIKFAFTSATSAPVINTIKGDPWYKDGINSHCRGWDATDSNRINVGTEVEYNPTPPAGATAKFRHQARLSFWASNHHYFNITNQQTIDGTTKLSVAAFLAYKIKILHDAVAFNTIKLDDAVITMSLSDPGIVPSDTDYGISTAAELITASYNQYAAVNEYIHTLIPGLLVGGNPYIADATTMTTVHFVKAGDYTVNEGLNDARNTGGTNPMLATPDPRGWLTYDDFLTLNDAGHPWYEIIIYTDNSATTYSPSSVGGPWAWDRANRGPIAALSKHLIGQNPGVYFNYHAAGSGYYDVIDEVYLKDSSVRHLSVDAAPTIDLVDHWGAYFPAMDANIGIPDAAGYNGGARDTAWILGTTATLNNAGSGTSHNLWRRDYTNAIVLHRSNGTAGMGGADYATYSLPIDLGGTYYPLKADGTTGDAITSIQLRRSEGAILMKAPAGGPADTVPPVTEIDKLPGRYQATQLVTASNGEGATIKYCLTLNASCTPSVTYSSPFKIGRNTRQETVCMASTDAAENAETPHCYKIIKQRRR
jgi:hypothetical protein